MRSLSIGTSLKCAALALAMLTLAACGGRGGAKHDVVRAANIPASFDVTILADKDGQFDYDGAPLTSQDLQSAFRYRQEESLPMSSVLLKRGEKQKIKAEHETTLARIALQMKFKAFVEEKGGEISELQAVVKDGEPAQAESPKKD